MSGSRAGSIAATSSASTSTRSLRIRSVGNPIRSTSTTPACVAPGSRTSPGFGAPNVTVRSARTAGPSTAPVSPLTPEGMSTATSGTGDAASAPIASAYEPAGAPRKPVPKIASIATSARSSSRSSAAGLEPATPHRRGPEPCEIRPRGTRERVVQEQHGGADARAVQVPGRDQAVATVVALAAHHDRAPPVRAADQPDGGVGDLAAGGLHQRVRGDPSLLGRAIELGRLRGRDHGAPASDLIPTPPPRTPPRSSSRG